MNAEVELVQLSLADKASEEAVAEVDASLIAWSLSLSDRERLRACTKAAKVLMRLQGDASQGR